MKKGQITKQKVISQAMDLIHVKGVTHTSMNDIIDASGVKKGNLYFHFSTKDELAAEAIEEAGRQYNKYLKSSISGAGGLDKLEKLIDAIVAFHVKRKIRGGCIFGNTAIEIRGTSSPLSGLIKRIFTEWTEQIEGWINEAAEKSGAGDIRPAALAKTVIATLEGAIMMAKLAGKTEDLIECAETLKRMVRAVTSS